MPFLIKNFCCNSVESVQEVVECQKLLGNHFIDLLSKKNQSFCKDTYSHFLSWISLKISFYILQLIFLISWIELFLFLMAYSYCRSFGHQFANQQNIHPIDSNLKKGKLKSFSTKYIFFPSFVLIFYIWKKFVTWEGSRNLNNILPDFPTALLLLHSILWLQ